MEVRINQAPSELEELRREWASLQERAGNTSLFLGDAWNALCCRHLPATDSMQLISIWRQGKLHGLVPMLDSRARIRGFPVRELRSLVNPLGAYAGMVLEEPAACMNAMLAFLSRQRQWQVVTFDRIRNDSPGSQALCAVLTGRSNITSDRVVSRTPYLEIKGTWEEFWRSKSPKFRKTKRSIANRVEKLGDVRVECVCGGGQEQSALAELLELSKKSWTRANGQDLLAEDFERAFLSDLTQVAAEKGWLRLWLLRKGRAVIAGEYHLREGDIEYAIRAHYDPSYSHASPGSFLDTSIVEKLFADGCRIYDMGPGVAGYKTAWTEAFYTCSSTSIFQDRPYTRFLGRLESEWIPMVKKSALARWVQRSRAGSSAASADRAGK